MIPNKSNFKFQELTPITGVKPYVIRFWETEFTEISPIMGDSGQKLYDRKDVEAILRIKKLLFEDKLSIPEAKQAIKKPVECAKEEKIISLPVSYSKNDEAIQAIRDSLLVIEEIKTKRKW